MVGASSARVAYLAQVGVAHDDSRIPPAVGREHPGEAPEAECGAQGAEVEQQRVLDVVRHARVAAEQVEAGHEAECRDGALRGGCGDGVVGAPLGRQKPRHEDEAEHARQKEDQCQADESQPPHHHRHQGGGAVRRLVDRPAEQRHQRLLIEPTRAQQRRARAVAHRAAPTLALGRALASRTCRRLPDRARRGPAGLGEQPALDARSSSDSISSSSSRDASLSRTYRAVRGRHEEHQQGGAGGGTGEQQVSNDGDGGERPRWPKKDTAWGGTRYSRAFRTGGETPHPNHPDWSDPAPVQHPLHAHSCIVRPGCHYAPPISWTPAHPYRARWRPASLERCPRAGMGGGVSIYIWLKVGGQLYIWSGALACSRTRSMRGTTVAATRAASSRATSRMSRR
eukprot:scaffold1574_cov119-Isochrysis_galbana.AAC.1